MSVPAIHPGEHLAEELRKLAMSAAELAKAGSVACVTQSGPSEVPVEAIRACVR